MNLTQIATSFFKEVDKNVWLRHGLFWLAYHLFFANMLIINWHWSAYSFIKISLFTISDILVTYLFLYNIIPQLKKRKIRDSIFIFITFLGGWYFVWRLQKYIQIKTVFFIPDEMKSVNMEEYMASNDGFMIPMTTILTAAAIKLFRDWYKKEQENKQLIEENLEIELQLLKSQIHPHFLFNTLNNLYALTLKQSHKAPEIVQRLSGLLGYIIEDCNVPQVWLSQEINLLKNYISLEQLRYGNRLNLQYGNQLSTYFENESQTSTIKIAPLLFLPFVENAFKHGSAEQLDNAYILIDLTLKENLLIFTVKNSKNQEIQSENYIGGIGLKNVKKRLELIYKSGYELTISPEETCYNIQLNLRFVREEQTQNESKIREVMESVF